MTRRAASPRGAALRPGVPDAGEIAELAAEVASHPETGPAPSGGDLDADRRGAHDDGDEAVGGRARLLTAKRAGRGRGGPARPD
jgi:hypothetical protein